MRIVPEKVPLESFTRACRARGLSVTHQRLAVYEAVLSSTGHPGAEEIYQAVRQRCPGISKGTVYRTLDTLCEMGVVNDIHRSADTSRFEAVLEPHHHLICLACRRVVDLFDDSLQKLRLPPGGSGGPGRKGFRVTGYQIQFTGYCGECAVSRRGPRPHSSRGSRPSQSSQPASKKEARHGKGSQGKQDAR